MIRRGIDPHVELERERVLQRAAFDAYQAALIGHVRGELSERELGDAREVLVRAEARFRVAKRRARAAG